MRRISMRHTSRTRFSNIMNECPSNNTQPPRSIRKALFLLGDTRRKDRTTSSFQILSIPRFSSGTLERTNSSLAKTRVWGICMGLVVDLDRCFPGNVAGDRAPGNGASSTPPQSSWPSRRRLSSGKSRGLSLQSIA